MGIGVLIGCIEAAIGAVTLNPSLVVDGATRAARSYIIGEILEPVKEIVGEGIANIIE